MNSKIMECAMRLAEWHVENEPKIEEIWLFPSDEEIRLVDLDPLSLPSEAEMTPFYYGADANIPYPWGVALIRPEQKGKVTPPEEWGPWDKAIKLWPRQ